MGKFYNSVLALLAIGVISLFVLHFTSSKKNNERAVAKMPLKAGAHLPIAYFDADSIVANYTYSKLRQAELEKLIQKAEDEIAGLNRSFEGRRNDLNKTAKTPEDQEKAMVELNKMMQDINKKKEDANANVQVAQQKFEVELRKNIQDYINKFNTPQRYSFIINDEPGFIYYRDTMLNITNEILNGLNEEYKTKDGK